MWALGNEPNLEDVFRFSAFLRLAERLSEVRDEECPEGRGAKCWHPITVPLADPQSFRYVLLGQDPCDLSLSLKK